MTSNRDKLLMVAFKLFLTKGYKETSMANLANASGLTKGAFHYHFRRKEDILSACLAYFFEDFLPASDTESAQTLAEFARQSGAAYAAALQMLIANGIPLAAYQAFMWTMIRDNPAPFRERQDAFLRKATALCMADGDLSLTAEASAAISRDLFALIEGTGCAISLAEPADTGNISAMFERTITDFLARLTAGV